MQDRPDARELLQAVQAFLEEQVVPALEGTKQFHARVAANVLAIVVRELADTDALRVEWRRLCALLGEDGAEEPGSDALVAHAVRRLNDVLAARIRRGDADGGSWHDAVLAHLRVTADERLRVSNPRYAGTRARP